LVISSEERTTLSAHSHVWAGRTGQRIATQAPIVLRAADGRPNRTIADELQASPMTILLWRRHSEKHRLAGLRVAPRPGREPIYD
jgi:FixJ family two-component response regulator